MKDSNDSNDLKENWQKKKWKMVTLKSYFLAVQLQLQMQPYFSVKPYKTSSF